MVTARATGTGVSCSAATTRYSRAMSCADGVSPCSGGRRSTHLDASSNDQERQVGPPAGDELGPQLTRARDADRAQVAVQGVEVEPFQRGLIGLVYHRRFLGSRSHTCSVPLTAAT